MPENEPAQDGHNAHGGGRKVTIVINTRPHEWGEKEIGYEQVVSLAYPSEPIGPNTDITVRYSRGPDGHGGGTLTAGHSVEVKDGMVFDGHRTTRS